MANPLLEELSSLEHDQWVSWAKSLLKSEPGISKERASRWEKLFVPYSELSEESKEQDREYARKAIGILQDKNMNKYLEKVAEMSEAEIDAKDVTRNDWKRAMRGVITIDQRLKDKGYDSSFIKVHRSFGDAQKGHLLADNGKVFAGALGGAVAGAAAGRFLGGRTILGGALGYLTGGTAAGIKVNNQQMGVRLPAKIKEQIESGYYSKIDPELQKSALFSAALGYAGSDIGDGIGGAVSGIAAGTTARFNTLKATKNPALAVGAYLGGGYLGGKLYSRTKDLFRSKADMIAHVARNK